MGNLLFLRPRQVVPLGDSSRRRSQTKFGIEIDLSGAIVSRACWGRGFRLSCVMHMLCPIHVHHAPWTGRCKVKVRGSAGLAMAALGKSIGGDYLPARMGPKKVSPQDVP